MSFMGDIFSSNKAPSYNAGAAVSAQGSANESTARLNANLNRYDSYGPGGSTTWQNQGDKWTQTQTLSPDQQKQFDTTNAIGNSVLGQAQQYAGALPNDSFSYDGAPAYQSGIDRSGLSDVPTDLGAYQDQATQTAYDRTMGMLNPQFDKQNEALTQQLANQGIMQGSDAYTTAFDDFNRNKNNAMLSASQDAIMTGDALAGSMFNRGLTSRQQGLSERTTDYNMNNAARQNYANENLTSRNQNLNELAALLQGSPALQMPGGSGGGMVNAQAPDVMGAYNTANNNALMQYQASQANQGAMLGGLSNLGMMAMMG
ncbi:hypothetical protein [Thalassospira lohafexi]|uniref:Uncharacterized protein n=1 Tax=Thalassospira lohafexi TaxID=744227 RepID=A0A2N3L0L1_9PROT|nr:hypothetical protein [Thalassospira lohafexi]PKR56343.1 hypothetical protein COO92_21295 [Thalassospira lohafexi]